MPEVETEVQGKKKRVRTGCLSCRKIHKKCDELKPICTLCKKKSVACIWPLNYGNMKKTKCGNSRLKQGHNKSLIYNKGDNLNEYADRLLASYKESSHQRLPIHNRKTDGPNEGFKILQERNTADGNIPLPSLIEVSKSPESNLVSNSKNRAMATSIIEREGILLSNPIIASASAPNRINSLYEFEPTSLADQQSPKLLLSNILNERSPEFGNKIIGDLTLQVDNRNDISTDSSNPLKLGNENDILSNKLDYEYQDAISNDIIGDSDVNSYTPESIVFSSVYNDLHNTFRDYMFTNAELNDLSVNATFRNLLNSPAPSFLDGSQKNLKDLLNINTQHELHYRTPNPREKSNSRIFDKELVNNELNIGHEDELDLFKNYLYEVAPWLDMFDRTRKFGTEVANYAQEDKALLYSIYAISSRQKEQKDRNYNPEKTIKLYQESLKLLIPTVNKSMNKFTISACVILCAFEMMSTNPKYWRHHSEGCHALFEANGINGFSNPLERALFWCYARMDVNSAVIGEQQTLIPSESWLPKNCSIYDLKHMFIETNDEDMYANYIVFLCSRVLNLISSHVGDYEKEWMFIWKEVVEWVENRSLHFKPVLEFEGDPFPVVLYLNGPSVSANQLYHMAIILLIQNKPRLLKVESSKYVVSTSRIVKI